MIADDYLSTLSRTTIRDLSLRDQWVRALITNNSADPDLTILEQIAVYWVENKTRTAKNLTRHAIPGLAEDYGIALYLDNELIYTNTNESTINESMNESEQLFSASRMISGIEKGKALEGSTSTAYLRRVRDKKDFKIAHFGGFLGEGNFSIVLRGIPDDVTPDDIRGIIIKGDFATNFSLYINNNYCGLITTNHESAKPTEFDMTSCNNSITPGDNTFLFVPTSKSLGSSFVAGGYVKVAYLTDSFNDINMSGTYKYYFPGIDGLINLYDGINVPGIVNNWVLNITFKNNYTTFLRIGNDTIFSAEGSPNYQTINLRSSQNLSWAPVTIPLRLGTTNLTNVTLVTVGKPADTFLVTDVSGSMDDCGESYTGLVCHYRCYWRRWWYYSKSCEYTGTCSNLECGDCNPGYYDDDYYVSEETICNRTRLEIAQDANKLAVSIILNGTSSPNKVGLDSFYSSIRDYQSLTNDKDLLNSIIDGYYASGGTCICCGINRARYDLDSSTNKKFMIVLTDGDANYYCDSFNDFSGSYDQTLAKNTTIEAGEYACANNVTVYTIAMGDGISADGLDTLKRTACNESLFFNAANASKLEEIYENISRQILLIANFSAQVIDINGSYITAHLSPDSYLEFNYTPIVKNPSQNEISVSLETEELNFTPVTSGSGEITGCKAGFTIPSGVRVLEASLASYSGPYWTSYLSVNNQPVFNLSEYSSIYVSVGDPFMISIPPVILQPENNTLYLRVEDDAGNISNCTFNNDTIILSVAVNSTVPRSDVLEASEGCSWNIEFEDGHFLTTNIPSTYAGSKNCSYTNASISYNPLDAYDYAVHKLLSNLDFDKDGRVFLNLNAEDLEIIVTVVTGVPYLWGPTFARTIIWKKK